MLNLSEPSQPPAKKSKGRRGLTAKQEKFLQAIISGKGPSEAHIAAGYNASNPTVRAIRAQEVLNHPLIQAKLAALQAKADRRSILSLSERLELLSENAKLPNKNAAHRNAQARVIEVLTKIAGDGAAEQQAETETAHGRVTRIVIDIFKNSPASTRASAVTAPVSLTAEHTTNGNGNGRH